MALNLKKQARNKTESLALLGKNITEENLSFLADLSEKRGINEKLDKNKMAIKTFL